jgi:hypothetical protein
MKYAVKKDSCGVTYIPSFMKTDTGIQAILTFYFRNFRGCKVCNPDGRDL